MLKIGNQALVSLLFVSATLKKSVLKNGKKVKTAWFINSLKRVPSIYPNSVQSWALPKIPLTWEKPRKQVFQEDWYNNFDANETTNILNYIIK